MLVYSSDGRQCVSPGLRPRRPDRAHQPSQVKAICHPLRTTILGLLHERAATVSEMAIARRAAQSTSPTT